MEQVEEGTAGGDGQRGDPGPPGSLFKNETVFLGSSRGRPMDAPLSFYHFYSCSDAEAGGGFFAPLEKAPGRDRPREGLRRARRKELGEGIGAARRE